MTDAELELARKLVASKRWRWAPGIWMAHGNGSDTTCVVLSEHAEHIHCLGSNFIHKPTTMVPDLSRPATQGCLWAMLDEALVLPSVFIDNCPAKWVVEIYPGGDRERFEADYKGEALARALLAAWSEL